jgi:hypothetical protein
MDSPDLFERYLDRRFRDRVALPVGKGGPRRRTVAIDRMPATCDAEMQRCRMRTRPGSTHTAGDFARAGAAAKAAIRAAVWAGRRP